MGELQELRGLLLEADPEADLPDLSNNWFSLAVSTGGGSRRSGCRGAGYTSMHSSIGPFWGTDAARCGPASDASCCPRTSRRHQLVPHCCMLAKQPAWPPAAAGGCLCHRLHPHPVLTPLPSPARPSTSAPPPPPPQSTQRVYGTFDAWDSDRSGSLSRAEFSRISQGTMSELFIGRVFEEHVAQRRKEAWPPPPPSPEGKLHLKAAAGEERAGMLLAGPGACSEAVGLETQMPSTAANWQLPPGNCCLQCIHIRFCTAKLLLHDSGVTACLPAAVIPTRVLLHSLLPCCMSQAPPAAAAAPVPAAHWGPCRPWHPPAPLGSPLVAAAADQWAASRVMRWT
jgi:hypothetical protein